MLSAQDNELLTRTGPGTPMGALFRRFWLPLLLPSELPAPDCPPIRVRVLGEDLVAFRDTDGRVGFIAQACPHRGASLFFGRNEECGLRCVYHGWKFDVEGNCVDMPSEPAESNFKQKVKATTYASAEWGGLVWIYMGPKEKQPPLPQYEFCVRHEAGRYENTHVWKWIQECNYAQALEGNIDTAHITYLHRRKISRGPGSEHGINPDGPAVVKVTPTEFGFAYGGRRDTADGRYYWRVTPYMLPTFTSIPGPAYNGSGHFLIPRDDETAWWLVVQPNYRPVEGRPPFADIIPGTWRMKANRDNDYLLDRELQRTTTYTGLPGNRVEDGAIIESMGPVYDRSREHLGTIDGAVIHMRRLMIRLAKQLQQGIEPEILQHPEWFRARPVEVVNGEPDFLPVWQADRAAFLAENVLVAPLIEAGR